MPKPLCMHIRDAGIEGPMWIYLAFLTRALWEQNFTEHPIGIQRLTRMTLTSPVWLRSNASPLRELAKSGFLNPGTRNISRIG